MADRNVRWLALTLFALVNLICWTGIAAVIGLAVSPSLNLGLEGHLREAQATGAALWERIVEGDSEPIAEPEQALTPVPAGTEEADDQPLTATLSPAAATTADTPQPDSTRVAHASVPADSQLTPGPEATLVSEPLLLADPGINDLALLNAEMDISASDRPVQIRYQEDALNAEIAALWLNNPDLPYRDVTVDLKRDQVVVTGRITVLGFGVSAEVTGELTAQDCVPVLEIERLSVAGVMTPRFVSDQVENMVLEAMTWYPADYPLCLEQIVLEETRATIYGRHR